MSVDNCIKRNERYLSKPNMQPLVVDVQNMDDLSALITHFNVGANRFVKASEFAAEGIHIYGQKSLPKSSTKVGKDLATHSESSISIGLYAPISATLRAMTIRWS